MSVGSLYPSRCPVCGETVVVFIAEAMSIDNFTQCTCGKAVAHGDIDPRGLDRIQWSFACVAAATRWTLFGENS